MTFTAPRPFSDRPFTERFESMGDEAEGMFEHYNDNWARLGHNRPKKPSGDDFKLHKLALSLRYMHDYMQETPTRLVEVQGIASRPLKIKIEKIAALEQWNNLGTPVWFWVWSTTRQTYAELPWPDMMKLINKEDVQFGKYPEGKAYISISSKLLPWVSG